MTTFLRYRQYILLTSQLFGCVICTYFIIKVNDYQVSWNLFNYFLPGLTNKLNILLQYTGTFILIIPLTIIICSLLYPENIPLKIMGSFFGIASTLLIVTSGIYKNTIGQIYNMKIIIIKKILTLEEKRFVFKDEYMQITNEKYKNSIDLYHYLQEHLLEKYFEIYDVKLTLLKEHIEIKLYANQVIQELTNIFLQEKQLFLNKIALNYIVILKYITYLGLGLITITLIFTFIRVFLENDKMIEGAKLAKETAELSAQNTYLAINIQHIISILTEYISKDNNEIVNAIMKSVVQKIKESNDAISLAFDKLTPRLDSVEKGINIHSEAISELQKNIK